MKLKFKKNDWKSRFVAKPFYTFIYVQYITSKRQGAYKLMKSDIIVIIMLYKNSYVWFGVSELKFLVHTMKNHFLNCHFLLNVNEIKHQITEICLFFLLRKYISTFRLPIISKKKKTHKTSSLKWLYWTPVDINVGKSKQ